MPRADDPDQSVRVPREAMEIVTAYQNGHRARPSQPQAIKALIQIGYEHWMSTRGPDLPRAGGEG